MLLFLERGTLNQKSYISELYVINVIKNERAVFCRKVTLLFILGIFLAFQTLNFAKQEELEQDEAAYF